MIYLVLKRTFDFIASLIASVILIVPIFVIALIIVIKDPGNPFYVQIRIGQNGKKIKVMKFRTMKVGADDLQHMLTPEQFKEYRKEYKLVDDPRLIGYKKAGDGEKCFGARLRKSSMDELPQIPINIFLKGNMAIVGPRPILKNELEYNYTREEQQKLLSLKPGLTGYWQAYARNNATYATGERQKMEMYYVDHASIGLDIRILFKTVETVISKNGAL